MDIINRRAEGYTVQILNFCCQQSALQPCMNCCHLGSLTIHFFIHPQDEVYAGQVVGENAKEGDIVVNVTKSKKLTNMRASGADDKARIIPPVEFSLEEALEYIKEDEYLEVTPHHLRIRKIILDEIERKRQAKQQA